MGKRSSKDLIKRIIISIQEKPKSINELTEEIKGDWTSVKENLLSLEKAGLVKEFNTNKKSRCFISTVQKLEKRNDTYFGLELTDKQNKLFETVYSQIKKEWLEKKGCLPGKVFLQKTFAKINELCKLDLPAGWYQYGALAVKVYEPEHDYNFFEELMTPKIEKCIELIVNEYSRIESTFRLKIKQYKESKKKIYLLKEDLFWIFTSDKFSISNFKDIEEKLNLFEKILPEIDDKKSKELVYEFCGIIIKLIKNLNKEDLSNSKIEISQTFTHLWGLVALYNYRNELRKFYPKEVLNQHFNVDIYLKRLDVEESLATLFDLIPQETNQNDPLYSKLQDAIKEIKISTTYKSIDNQDELIHKVGLD